MFSICTFQVAALHYLNVYKTSFKGVSSRRQKQNRVPILSGMLSFVNYIVLYTDKQIVFQYLPL